MPGQTRPTLYMMLGYPGAGKTHTARLIAAATGALHLWEDKVRLELFPHPTFTHEENIKLYDYMNQGTEQILKQGKSIIFDTSFNMYADRVRVRDIASRCGADSLLIWVQTPREIAMHRATVDAASKDTRVLATVVGDMDHATFDRLAGKLEAPHPDEHFLVVDGTRATVAHIREQLGLA